MGNCQAIDAATFVVQHPCGKVDKFYWPVSASEIMRMNPGHYVALLISTTLCNSNSSQSNNSTDKCPNITTDTTTTNGTSVRLTRIKLLRPTDTLVLGQVYRLITSQDVMKGLMAKKHAKMNKNRPEISAETKPQRVSDQMLRRSEQLEKDDQVMKHERHRTRTTTASTNPGASKSRIWQPSLQSISEAAS